MQEKIYESDFVDLQFRQVDIESIMTILLIAAVLMQQKAFWTELTISVKLSAFLSMGRNQDERKCREFSGSMITSIFNSPIEAGIEVLRLLAATDLEKFILE